jgi:hypothetical protein
MKVKTKERVLINHSAREGLTETNCGNKFKEEFF